MTERALSFGSVAAAYERFRPGTPTPSSTRCSPTRAGRSAWLWRSVRAPARPLACSCGAGSRSPPPIPTRPCCGSYDDRCRDRHRAGHLRGSSAEPGLRPGLRRSVSALDQARRSLDSRRGMLRPAGIFASFGGQVHLADPEVERAVHAVRSPFLADDDVASPDGTPADSPMQWPGSELTRSDRFTDVRQSVIARRTTTSAREYVGHLSTISAYLTFPTGASGRARPDPRGAPGTSGAGRRPHPSPGAGGLTRGTRVLNQTVDNDGSPG